VPEGDTIYRTAVSLRRWLGGREITSARSRVLGPMASRLVGANLDAVEAKGKHLLMRFSSGDVLHTHMRMNGTWHVYPAGERWRRPADEARLVLEAGDRVAVCFNAPVIELLAAREERVHPGLRDLGPDVLVDPVDLDEVRRRAATRPPAITVGELLLDQRVVSGIGNIWRCETLFACRVNPWTPVAEVGDLDHLIRTASRLMQGTIGKAPPSRRAVYRRTGRPCPRCRTPITSTPLGDPPRTVYWCPTCQESST
jgi:endonuclease-8